MIVVFFGLQGWFAGGGIWSQAPANLAGRFPTEVRTTASGFCFHQGAIWGDFARPRQLNCRR
jgi:MFS transporter, SHS family, lactate transporter